MFNVTAEGLNRREAVVSKESHIDFEWVVSEDLAEINLMPDGMFKLIKSWEMESRAHLFSTLT